MEKRWLSVRELAEYIDMSESKVRHMASKLTRYIPFEGKKMYFDREEIDQIILASRIPSATELAQQHEQV